MDARTEMIESIRSEIALIQLERKAQGFTTKGDRLRQLTAQLDRLTRNDQADFMALMGAFGGRR